MSKGDSRDDCWAEFIVSVFKENEKKGIAIVEKEISDPKIADYIWLKVTREYNPSTRKFCEKIRMSLAKERCLTLVSRPHLHREVLRKKSDLNQK